MNRDDVPDLLQRAEHAGAAEVAHTLVARYRSEADAVMAWLRLVGLALLEEGFDTVVLGRQTGARLEAARLRLSGALRALLG